MASGMHIVPTYTHVGKTFLIINLKNLNKEINDHTEDSNKQIHKLKKPIKDLDKTGKSSKYGGKIQPGD